MVHYTDEKNLKLFRDHNIYTEVEVRSRQEIILETYAKALNIEALTAIDMVKKDIIPAVSAYVAKLTNGVLAKRTLSASIPCTAELDIITALSSLEDSTYQTVNELERAMTDIKSAGADVTSLAFYHKDRVIPIMNELRSYVDGMETMMSSEFWPYPTYADLMFRE